MRTTVALFQATRPVSLHYDRCTGIDPQSVSQCWSEHISGVNVRYGLRAGQRETPDNGRWCTETKWTRSQCVKMWTNKRQFSTVSISMCPDASHEHVFYNKQRCTFHFRSLNSLLRTFSESCWWKTSTENYSWLSEKVYHDETLIYGWARISCHHASCAKWRRSIW